MVRVDMFLTGDSALVVNEINTIPGFTAISMHLKLWALSGITPTQRVIRLIDLAVKRAERKGKLRRSFVSQALSS